jgi:hypothetical protein
MTSALDEPSVFDVAVTSGGGAPEAGR